MNNGFCEILKFLTTGFLGLFAGALSAEGALLVPYWRSLSASEFFALHKVYGPRLYKFYAPLTITASVLAVASAAICLVTENVGRWSALAAGVLALLMIAIYFVYFKNANEKFAKATVNADELPSELACWATWHWVRVVIAITAFAASLYALFTA